MSCSSSCSNKHQPSVTAAFAHYQKKKNQLATNSFREKEKPAYGNGFVVVSKQDFKSICMGASLSSSLSASRLASTELHLKDSTQNFHITFPHSGQQGKTYQEFSSSTPAFSLFFCASDYTSNKSKLSRLVKSFFWGEAGTSFVCFIKGRGIHARQKRQERSVLAEQHMR